MMRRSFSPSGRKPAFARTLCKWRPLMPSLLLILALALAGCRSTPTPSPVAGPVTVVKLIVDTDGMYEVTSGELAAVGFDLANAEPADLVLSAGGQPVGFQLVAEKGERAVRFYGQSLGKSAYTGQNVYWLAEQPSHSGEARGAIGVQVRAASPLPETMFTTVVSATVRAEEQRRYVPKVGPDDDRWLWDAIFAPGKLEIPIATPHLAPGKSVLRLRVWGNSSAPVNPDHHLALILNDVPVADATWDGIGAHLVTATVATGVLRADENRLTIQAPGDTGAMADAVLVDWAEITYPRELVADGGELMFGGQAPGFAVDVGGQVAALWDITEPSRPVALTGYQVDGGQVRFAADGSPRRFILVTEAGLRRPAALTPAGEDGTRTSAKGRERVPEASPRSSATTRGSSSGQTLYNWPGGADMIIVTVPQFQAALQPLVTARQAAGLRVALVDVTAIYDSFNYGRADPAAIRTFVRQARANWEPPAPRFLLLAGDASYDPRGYLGGSEADLVPTHLVDTAFTGWTASDVWYALPSDALTARPALAVGRFPAQTADQMSAMVAKTLAYEQISPQADWRNRALFLADNDDPGFASTAEVFAAALPNYTSQVITVSGDGTGVRADLLQAFDAGMGLLGYFGHGSLSLWAQEKIFSVDDVRHLTNRNKLPLVFTVTCLSGFFQHPTTPSLGEVLLRAPSGGAVAALVPSSAALLGDQRLMSDALAHALAEQGATGRTLGEVIQEAQTNPPITSAGTREILLTFNLLGDPALRLR